MMGICSDQSYLLNDCLIPFSKWPAAVQSLIQRTQIRQLIVHCGSHDRSLLDENPTVLARLIEIFKENTDRMKIDDFEFHYGNIRDASGSGIDKIRSFLLDSLQMFTPYLEELMLNIGHESIGNAPIWPLIKECHRLKVIYLYYSNQNSVIDVDALIGKSLTEVTFFDFMDDDAMDDIVQVLNGVSGDGIHQVSLKDPYKEDFDPRTVDLKEFCDSLSENSRNKLKFITELDVFKYIFTHFPMIPSMFPNLERFAILNIDFCNEDDLNEFFTNIAAFLNVSHAEHRMLLIKTLRLYDDDLEALYDEFQKACRAANIEPDFLYYMDDDHEISQISLLAKGKATVRIMKLMDENNDQIWMNYNGLNFHYKYRESSTDDEDGDDELSDD